MNDNNLIRDDYLNSVLEKIAIKSELESWNYEKQFFQDVAQNYFGVIIPIKLNGKKEGQEISLNLVLKLAPTDERYRVSGAVTSFFQREIFIYSDILPAYRKIRNDITTLSDFIVPECYYIKNDYCEEVIAMQNMCANGFIPFVNESILDIEHLMISIKCLANFHALSFILKKQENHLFNIAQSTCVPLSNNANERFITILLDRLTKALKVFSNTQYVPALQRLEKDCDKFVELCYKSVNALVLCHGDIWKENLLFKYEHDKPVSVCMIDYQTTRISSPAYDVLYLIISSSAQDLRRQYYNQLLDTYYQTLSENMLEAKMPINTIYSRQMFDADLITVAPACLVIANTAIWLSSGCQQEGHVKSKIVLETEEDIQKAICSYKNRMTAILDDLISYGYLNNVLE
ncbi:uncharacterized protein LOC110995380 [Pieris rapae]|uniref:uncharacterized protein LOC110995380 n=1 Tax=Pieris rapae TaxID=64459 RepID=UPI001E27B0E6|nr:uncharacterized protein LOC110995380 [Pieris rapae]